MRQGDTEHDARPGKVRRANLRDVASLAGVAVSSASRVISDHPDVSPVMRRKVMDAIAQLEYQPDYLAQSIRRGATLSVGFVVRDITSPLLASIALGAETRLRSKGYSLVLFNSEADPRLDGIRSLEYRRLDGLLVSLIDEHEPSALEALRRIEVPMVMIDRDVDLAGCSAVLADHELGMRAVVAHLAGLGHRSIGLVSGPLQVRPGRQGAETFLEECARMGVRGLVESGPFAVDHGLSGAERFLSGDDRPTALIAGSNQIFPGVLQAIRRRRLRIPTDISLVTFDDLPLLQLLEPPVDVVTRGPQRFGEIAADLLLKLLAGDEPETVLVPTQLEIRGSSGPPPG